MLPIHGFDCLFYLYKNFKDRHLKNYIFQEQKGGNIMIKRVYLGEVDYFSQKANAYREVYPDHWAFVLETPNGKFTLLNY